MADRIHATYRLVAPPGDAHRVADDICIEQTVEAHRSLASEPRFTEGIVGRVESIANIEDDVHEAVISYPVRIMADSIPQLLQVLYGNVSLMKGIRLERVHLPDSFAKKFGGPRFGIRGIREMLGVFDRPLLAAALKPMGLTPRELADRALALARGGIDILKDDHGLTDHEFCPFEERVKAVCEALARARRETGRRTLYLASLTERFDLMVPSLRRAMRLGADGVLTSPLVTGLDAMRHVASLEDVAPVVAAHPALCGAFFCSADHGISHGVLLGTLMRLAGADMVIFPTHGGRFPLDRDQCDRIALELRSPMNGLDPAWPMPAGGIDVESVPGLRDGYGDDTIFLIGSSLYTRSPDLESNASRFLSLVESRG